MKQILLTLLLLGGTFKFTFAQTEKDKSEVHQSILAYLDAFYTGDSLKILNHFSPNIVKFGYYKAKDSAHYAGFPMTYKNMFSYVAAVKTGKEKVPANPIKKVEILDIQDQTASGKVTAWWGTDYMLLAKEKGKWMIRMVLWQGPLNSEK